MRPVVYVAIFFCSILFSLELRAQTPSYEPCWTPNGRQMTMAEYQGALQCVGDRLELIWDQEIKDAAIYAGGDETKLRGLKLVLANNCLLLPNFDPRRRHPTVVYNRNLLHFSYYLQQGLYIYLLNVGDLGDPAVFSSYVENEIAVALKKEINTCEANGQRQLARLQSYYITGLKKNGQDYEGDLHGRLNQQTALLAEFVVSYPIFFTFLHEAAHHLNRQEHGVAGRNAEFAADQFASRTFSMENLPVTLAVTYLHTLYEIAELDPIAKGAADKREIACRIVRIVEEDQHKVSAFTEYGRSYAQQLERLRTFYVRKFRTVCDA